jgi:hypothetical protein
VVTIGGGAPQPALFVVGALSSLDRAASVPPPSLLAGHSLGEYAALFAAGCFDFATGVRLVRRRGDLMSRARGGGILAMVRAPVEAVTDAGLAAAARAAPVPRRRSGGSRRTPNTWSTRSAGAAGAISPITERGPAAERTRGQRVSVAARRPCPSGAGCSPAARPPGATGRRPVGRTLIR